MKFCSICSVAILSLLLLAAPAKLKGDVTFDVNLSGVTEGVPGFAEPSLVTVTGSIMVDPDQPVTADNLFINDLTFTQQEMSVFLPEPPFEIGLTEIEFEGDTASNLDFVVVDGELAIRRIGTGDSRLRFNSPSDNFFFQASLTFGSGEFVSDIGFVNAGGGFGFFDSFVIREAGGIDNGNGIGLNASAIPEPNSTALLGLFIATIGLRRKRC